MGHHATHHSGKRTLQEVSRETRSRAGNILICHTLSPITHTGHHTPVVLTPFDKVSIFFSSLFDTTFIFPGICNLLYPKSAWLPRSSCNGLRGCGPVGPLIKKIPEHQVRPVHPDTGRRARWLRAARMALWLAGHPGHRYHPCRPDAGLAPRGRGGAQGESGCHVSAADIRDAAPPCTRRSWPSTRNVTSPGSILRRRGSGLVHDEKFGRGNGANTSERFRVKIRFLAKEPV